MEQNPEYSEGNKEKLREIYRKIASAIIFSKDGKMLLGKKDPSKGGVYPDDWHIPGGGVEENETLEDALTREITQEVIGLDISKYNLKKIPLIGKGETVKTLSSGERVWCKMEFNRFEIHLDKSASELVQEVAPGDDLVELRWFSKAELATVSQAADGKEFFKQAGYID